MYKRIGCCDYWGSGGGVLSFVCVRTVGYEVIGSGQHQTQGELPPIVCKAEGVGGVSVLRPLRRTKGLLARGVSCKGPL